MVFCPRGCPNRPFETFVHPLVMVALGRSQYQNAVNVIKTIRPLDMTGQSQMGRQARTTAAVLCRVRKALNHALGRIPCEMPCERSVLRIPFLTSLPLGGIGSLPMAFVECAICYVCRPGIQSRNRAPPVIRAGGGIRNAIVGELKHVVVDDVASFL